MKSQKFNVTGMSCAACQARVQKSVSNMDGVLECSVNLVTNSMQVQYEDNISDEQIIDTVKKAGYGAEVFKEEERKVERFDKATKKLFRRLLISLSILVPLFYIAMGYMVPWYIFGLEQYPLILGIIEAILSLAILIVNYQFFVNAYNFIFHGDRSMGTLVALGSGTAFIYSFVLLILVAVNYSNSEMMSHYAMNYAFETAGMVPTFITIGKTLEAYSKGKTTNAIKSLIKLMPKEAHLLKGDEIIDVDINEIKISDLILVKPGETFPVDGIIVNGVSSVNEAMLTGESMPIDKNINDEVKTGTLNLSGALTVKATKVGKDTILSKIIKMVEDASLTKSKISKSVDRVSLIFVPVVVGISIIVFIFWLIFGQDFVINHLSTHNTLLSYSFDRAIAVLVIACPCALGLATPVAIMVGNGKAAKNGILIKSAEAIEKSAVAKFVVLDKTGTITKGSPEVTDIVTDNEKEFISIAYSLEVLSDHPLAKAIVQKANDYEIDKKEVTDFANIPGVGVKGVIDNVLYQGVNETYLVEHKIENIFKDKTEQFKKEAKTLVFILKEATLYGVFAIKDEVKEDSKEAINELKNLGLIPVMLTGDNEASAKEIAAEVEIDKYVYKVLPDDKLEIIKRLQEHGLVIMVGDGINDAPALTQADVAFAIKRGSDIAIDSADIILMKSTLKDVASEIRLARATVRNIKENLFWAFFYNLIMIPIAAGVFSPLGLYSLKPYMGAAAMSLSSITVVLNALRLNLFKLYDKNKFAKKNDFDLPNIDLEIEKEDEGMTKTVVNVKGMMCMHCVARVEKALIEIEGVDKVKVDLNKGTATIKSKEVIDSNRIKDAIVNAGYEVTNIEN